MMYVLLGTGHCLQWCRIRISQIWDFWGVLDSGKSLLSQGGFPIDTGCSQCWNSGFLVVRVLSPRIGRMTKTRWCFQWCLIRATVRREGKSDRTLNRPRGSSRDLGALQRRSACSLRRDATHRSRSVEILHGNVARVTNRACPNQFLAALLPFPFPLLA